MWTAETTSSTGSSATGASACGTSESAAGPVQAPFSDDVLEVVLDQLADARAAVDVRDDLEQEVRRVQATPSPPPGRPAWCL